MPFMNISRSSILGGPMSLILFSVISFKSCSSVVLWSQHPVNYIQFSDSVVDGVKVVVCCQQVFA